MCRWQCNPLVTHGPYLSALEIHVGHYKALYIPGLHLLFYLRRHDVVRSSVTVAGILTQSKLILHSDSHRTPPSRIIPLSAVSSTHTCELTTGLHFHIHNKFMNILGQSFKPVPSSGEYFYFYHSPRQQTVVCCSVVSFLGTYLLLLLLLNILLCGFAVNCSQTSYRLSA